MKHRTCSGLLISIGNYDFNELPESGELCQVTFDRKHWLYMRLKKMVLMKCKNDGICVSDTSTAGTIAACQEQPKSSEFVNMYIPVRHLHNCKQLLHLIDKSLNG